MTFSDVFIVNFKLISHHFLVFLLLTVKVPLFLCNVFFVYPLKSSRGLYGFFIFSESIEIKYGDQMGYCKLKLCLVNVTSWSYDKISHVIKILQGVSVWIVHQIHPSLCCLSVISQQTIPERQKILRVLKCLVTVGNIKSLG